MLHIVHRNNQSSQAGSAMIPGGSPAGFSNRPGSRGNYMRIRFQLPAWFQTLVSRRRSRAQNRAVDIGHPLLPSSARDSPSLDPFASAHVRPLSTFKPVPPAVMMHDAIIRNDLDLLKYLLLVRGIDPNKLVNFTRRNLKDGPNPNMQSLPIHVAAIYRRPDVVKILLDNGAKVDALDWAGRTPLEMVITYWPRVPFAPAFDPDRDRDRDEMEFQLWEQHQNSLQCMIHLVQHGADVHTTVSRTILDRVHRQTLLHCTAMHTLPLAAEWLIRCGADIEARDAEGNTPLITAAKIRCVDVAELLMSLGADPRAQDVFGNAPLHFLVHRARDSLVRLALELGADPNAANESMVTPLHVAAEKGNSHAIKLLLLFGANPNLLDKKGRSALFCVLDNERHFIGSVRSGISLLLRETLYTKVIDNDGKLAKLLNQQKFIHLRDSLIQYTGEPPTLMKMCKMTIRKSIGLRNIRMTKIDKLPLPNAIKRYVFAPWCFYCKRCECYRPNHPKCVPSSLHIRVPTP